MTMKTNMYTKVSKAFSIVSFKYTVIYLVIHSSLCILINLPDTFPLVL